MLDFLRRLQRLSDIDRCSNSPHINRYPVSAHSFYVALYAMIFVDMENERKSREHSILSYDDSLVIRKALIHDLEESETGDILYPVHNMYKEFKEKLDEVRDLCVKNIIFEELPSMQRAFYIILWRQSKDDSIEGHLVAMMDKFEILMFAVKELSMGNESFRHIYNNAKNILEKECKIQSVLDVLSEIKEMYG